MSTHQQRIGGRIDPVQDWLDEARHGSPVSMPKSEVADQAARAILTFGSFRLDPLTAILFHGDKALPFGRRPVVLLRVLIERQGLPVSKEALIEATWGGRAVEECNLTVQIAAIRRALAEEPGGQLWIETLPRRGYRYVGPRVAARRSVHIKFPEKEDAGSILSEILEATPNNPVREIESQCGTPGDHESHLNAAVVPRSRALDHVLTMRACVACGRPRILGSQRRLSAQHYRRR
jgi:DNA-binding winged helix-turn-helix (wHTH) protein